MDELSYLCVLPLADGKVSETYQALLTYASTYLLTYKIVIAYLYTVPGVRGRISYLFYCGPYFLLPWSRLFDTSPVKGSALEYAGVGISGSTLVALLCPGAYLKAK